MTRRKGLETYDGKPLGGIRLLTSLPPWAVITLVTGLSTGMVGALRWLFERTYYDRALSSLPGDSILGLYLASVSWLIRREGVPHGIHESPAWHVAMAGTCAVASTLLYYRPLQDGGGGKTVANAYHGVAVVGPLSYLVVSTLPVTIKAANRRMQYLGLTCLVTWCALLAVDIAKGNLRRNGPRPIK
jgi:hypothetical protein